MSNAGADYKRLGRLASLGPKEPWQVALFLPESYEDFTQPLDSALDLDRDPRPVWLTIAGPCRAYYDRVPRLVLPVSDDDGGTINATIFGDTKEWMTRLEVGKRACFLATGKDWQGRWQIEIRELVEDEWVGRIRPKYTGKKQVITPQTTRTTVLGLLPDAIPRAATFIQAELDAPVELSEVLRQVGAAGWSLEQLLRQAHQPLSMRHALHAQRVLKRVAAVGGLQRMHRERGGTQAHPIVHTTIAQRIEALPFERLTDDQHSAIARLSAEMARPAPLRALLGGEVGSGKTSVCAVLAAATVDAVPTAEGSPGGGRVLILCPNTLLAKQLHSEISSYYPDIPMQLVIGKTASAEQLDAPILVGTSALLFRDTGRQRFDLVVVDESHRWSREQREHHVHPGTHLLEMSATPIPRSMALVRYGKSLVIHMKQTHAEKRFHTHTFEGDAGRREMFKRLHASIKRGQRVLVVHPKRDASEVDGVDKDLLGREVETAAPAKPKGGIDDRHSVGKARERWEAMYPGLVGALTSDDDEVAKDRTLTALKDGRIQILLCTTVIEVGITIPELFIIVVVCPERMGLMQLHQLRGRVARGGGDGHCVLYSPEPLAPKQRERLEFFSNTTDGLELAEYDMRERGIGDLSAGSSKQSGADETFLFGIKMDVESLDEVAPLVERWRNSDVERRDRVADSRSVELFEQRP